MFSRIQDDSILHSGVEGVLLFLVRIKPLCVLPFSGLPRVLVKMSQPVACGRRLEAKVAFPDVGWIGYLQMKIAPVRNNVCAN